MRGFSANTFIRTLYEYEYDYDYEYEYEYEYEYNDAGNARVVQGR